MNRWIAACLVGVVMVGGGCSADEESRVNREERRQFYVVMESKLRQIDRGINQLDSVTSEADSVYAGDVERLKDNGRTLRGRLAAMNSASNEEWPALRDSIETYYHGVRTQYATLVSRATQYASTDRDSASTAVTPTTPKGASN
jgi:hypothetical protein